MSPSSADVFAFLQYEALVALAVVEVICLAAFHSRVVDFATRLGKLDPMTRVTIVSATVLLNAHAFVQLFRLVGLL